MMKAGDLKILIERGDVLFADSPPIGDADCVCSRCGQVICEVPVRIFKEEGRGGEYRFHPTCVGLESERGQDAGELEEYGADDAWDDDL